LSSEVGNAALKHMALSSFAKCNRGATATEKNFSEFSGLFSYQAIMRILILCLCNKQLIFFRNMFLKGSFWLFFNAESSPEDIKYGQFTLLQGGLTF